jgi:ribosomal protein S18 acetylase RimI-like enzyme
MFPSKNGTQYSIKPCHPNDIKDVYAIESKIESGNAAQESTLFERLNMFPNGFLIAKNEKGKVVGYLESVIWNDIAFDRFDEICDFPLHYDPSGDTLYIIYVAVEERSRGLYIGLELVRAAIDLALSLRVKRIKLVAKDNRIGLYQKCGFSYIKELPNFLSSKTTKNILMVREL